MGDIAIVESSSQKKKEKTYFTMVTKYFIIPPTV